MTRVTWQAFLLSAASVGCADVDRFDNSDGSAYCGSIVDASFVRQGFAQHTRIQLELDIDARRTLPGRISTDDYRDGPCAPEATFDDAQLRTPEKLQADPLSLLAFGEAREVNLFTWVESSCDGTYLAIVSLMKNDDVEVRLTRGQEGEDGEEAGPFGVFHLSRFSHDCGYQQP
jgi:hypothetical protein